MSRLPNAPLLEVIYELRWTIKDKADIQNYQYLHGDLYSELKDQYKYRETINSLDIPAELLKNVAVYRFRKEKNSYPLFQIGPGVLTLNTDDENYFWDEYFQWSKQLTEKFIKIYTSYETEKVTSIKPSLTYIDFFDLSKEKDVISFINENLSIKIQTGLEIKKKDTTKTSFNLLYEVELGDLNLLVATGKNRDGEEGLVLQTNIKGKEVNLDTEPVFEWLEKAHEYCSTLFEELTHGKLYNSFK